MARQATAVDEAGIDLGLPEIQTELKEDFRRTSIVRGWAIA
jgi:hypothetical protein